MNTPFAKIGTIVTKIGSRQASFAAATLPASVVNIEAVGGVAGSGGAHASIALTIPTSRSAPAPANVSAPSRRRLTMALKRTPHPTVDGLPRRAVSKPKRVDEVIDMPTSHGRNL
jgi:hypothetical protein